MSSHKNELPQFVPILHRQHACQYKCKKCEKITSNDCIKCLKHCICNIKSKDKVNK